MTALRMVLEESLRLPDLRATLLDTSAASMAHKNTPLHTIYTTDETLLPPLPESGSSGLSDAQRPSLVGLSSASSNTPLDLAPSESSLTMPARSNSSLFAEPRPDANIYIVPELYALDSLALSIDPPPIAFPPVESQSLAHGPLQCVPSLPPSSTSSTNTSPLRRLKSIKNGIRKLSFSRMGVASQTSVAALDISPLGGRPLQLPSQSESLQHDSSLLSSTGESLRLMFSNCATPLSAGGNVPAEPSHTHSCSVGLSGLSAKTRHHALSASGPLTPATPPLPLPVVTLSVDLSSTKKTMASVEQSFFDNWCPTATDTSLQGLAATQDPGAEATERLTVLSTPDDLLEYLAYLSEHKKSVELAYEVSKSRLISSGWCSGHDIENLNLQRDSSLSQIDSKLLQIEERLNSEFNMSFLNDKHLHGERPRGKCATRATLSPSLKDLENKCLNLYAEHGSLCQ